jgi:hypothetical protein
MKPTSKVIGRGAPPRNRSRRRSPASRQEGTERRLEERTRLTQTMTFVDLGVDRVSLTFLLALMAYSM